jgi:hypothetical protein
MNRFIVGLMVCLMLAVNVYGLSESELVREYTIVSTSGDYTTTNIPVTSIRPAVDKLVGYSIMRNTNNTNSSECVIAIYDSTASTLTGEQFGECEAIDETTNGELYVKHREIECGVTVRQGPNTIAKVLFTAE